MDNFKNWLEHADIFGFTDRKLAEPKNQDFLEKPIRGFNTEIMMDILSEKSIGLFNPNSFFMNEMQWGEDVGSVKLSIDTGFTFYVKRLIPDLEGTPVWVTKKMLQLNRQGYGSYEDSVAGEIHDHLREAFDSPLDTPKAEFHDLENLTNAITRKIKRVCNSAFVYERVQKTDVNNYLIICNIKAGGVGLPGQSRGEKNITHINFKEETGIISVMNYNVESQVGRNRSWLLSPLDLELKFCPTQSFEEIAECVGVHYKFY